MPDLIDIISSNFAWQNFFEAQLDSDITDTDTDIPMNSVPTPSEGVLVLDYDVPAKREIIFYNSKTASKVVATQRGFDSTSAVSHTSGAKVRMAPIAAFMKYVKDVAEAASNPATSRFNTLDASHSLSSGGAWETVTTISTGLTPTTATKVSARGYTTALKNATGLATALLRVGISLDGGSTWTNGAQQVGNVSTSAGGTVRSQLAAEALEEGTPTGEVQVRIQVQGQDTGVSFDNTDLFVDVESAA